MLFHLASLFLFQRQREIPKATQRLVGKNVLPYMVGKFMHQGKMFCPKKLMSDKLFSFAE